jgi:site-specific DNA-methyltransferase (adenine-specific)
MSNKIKNASVDLILTDLPYGTAINIDEEKNINHGMKGKTEWDIIINLSEIYDIANRILRKNGKMILFAQEPFTTRLINETIPNIPFNYRCIWLKDHFANSLIAKNAMVNYFEDILIFSKKYDFEGLHPLREYFKLIFKFIGLNKKQIIDKIGQCVDHVFRINSSQYDLCTKKTYEKLIQFFEINKMLGFKSYNELCAINKKYTSTFNLWEGKKFKSNILNYKKDYDGYHPTQKPVLLLEDLIKTFSNDNDLVVDLTMGSGSTGVACINTNRNFIGIELDQKYYNIAKSRLEEVK